MSNYDYGKCQVCEKPLLEKLIRQDFWIRENLVVIENVPTGVCPQCGEKIVRADIGRHIASLLSTVNQAQPVRSISVPVIEFREVA
ncbi:MAG: YgiT-type zinc finger protein [Blastocatellia bacterium]